MAASPVLGPAWSLEALQGRQAPLLLALLRPGLRQLTEPEACGAFFTGRLHGAPGGALVIMPPPYWAAGAGAGSVASRALIQLEAMERRRQADASDGGDLGLVSGP